MSLDTYLKILLPLVQVQNDNIKMNSTQHILIPCHAWYGDMIGGAFRLATEFAQHLAERGHRVTYVCCQTARSSATDSTEDGVHVVRYPEPPDRLNRLLRLRYHVRQTRQLCRQLHRTHPVTAVSSHSPLQGLGAAQAFRRSGVPICYTVHSPFDDELLSNAGPAGPTLLQKLAAKAARHVDRRNVALATRVQTDSAFTLQQFVNKYGTAAKSKGIVAPGWVDAQAFQPVDNRAELRQTMGEHWDTAAPVFFTLRRLERRMGLDTLVEACAQIASEGHSFRTLIGGSGSMKNALQQMIDDYRLTDHVRLLGRLPEDDLASAYAAADCFVLPTRALECFGLIVLEAFACNTPVIASAAAAIPELAAKQGTEWMFEPGNVEQLTDRLRGFLTGKLKPTIDLRKTAEQFARPHILRQWESNLLELTGQEHDDPD